MGQITSLLAQLGVNDTFFVMFGLFAVTYFVVSSLLTRPMGNLLVERDRRTTGRQEEITKIRIELNEIVEKLARERHLAQVTASTKFAELRNAAVNEQRKILTAAREEFSTQVKIAREKVEAAAKEEKIKLERSLAELKDEIIAKLLGTSTAKNISFGKEA